MTAKILLPNCCSIKKTSLLSLLPLLLSLFVLDPAKCAPQQSSAASNGPVHCWINVTDGYHDNQPLLLRDNVSEFLYPQIYNPSSFETNAGNVQLRVACPSDLLVADGETLATSAAFLKCHDGNHYNVGGSQFASPFHRITCSKTPMPLAKVKKHHCPIGKCLQIGFQMNIFTFLPVIETIAYDAENKEPIWAHAKIVPVIQSRQLGKAMSGYRMGPFLQNITMDMADVYGRDYQKRRFQALFNNHSDLEGYVEINDMDDKYFVEGQLISKNDFYYHAQQEATFYYENVVPVWPTVNEGNWHRVGMIIRRLAGETMAELDVWSGCLGVLSLTNSKEYQKKIYLGRDLNGKSIIPVPKVLFKYVYDRKQNRGLVFLTVNNPHVDKISSDYVICKKQAVCETMFPEFNHIDQGYTYCCTLDGFTETAKSLNLPIFAGATSLS